MSWRCRGDVAVPGAALREGDAQLAHEGDERRGGMHEAGADEAAHTAEEREGVDLAVVQQLVHVAKVRLAEALAERSGVAHASKDERTADGGEEALPEVLHRVVRRGHLDREEHAAYRRAEGGRHPRRAPGQG